MFYQNEGGFVKMHVIIHQQNDTSRRMYILGLHIRKARKSDRDGESNNCC